MRTAHRVRLAAVLALGAFAVHQLRYLVAFGGNSSAELTRQGHGYMADALPVLAVFGLSALLATVLRGRFGSQLSRGSLPRRAVLFAAVMLAIFSGQEWLEGLLAAGHPSGVGAVLASGGWLALPLALAVGAVAALLIGALERVEVALSALVARPHARRRAPAVRGRAVASAQLNPLIASLAFGLARRPPPVPA
jgi:hypothetical protein